MTETKKIHDLETGEKIELTEQSAKNLLKQDRYVEDHGTEKTVKQKQNNPKPEDQEKQPMSLPVKTGGNSWIDATLFFGNSAAEEDYKKSSSVKLTKKKFNDNDEVEELGDPIHLSPTVALNLSPVLQQLGFKGKVHDKKQK